MIDGEKLDTIRAVARDNHGLVTLRQLQTANVNNVLLRACERHGHLVRMCPGFFRTDESADTWELQARAALAWAGEDAALCHESAAALNGLKGYGRAGVIHVTRPVRWRVPKLRSFELVAHWHDKLDYWDASLYEGLRATRVERTLMDLGRKISRDQLEELIDHALMHNKTKPKRLWACFKRLKKRGRGGAGPFGWILHHRGKTLVRVDSTLEKDLHAILADAKMPLPIPRWWVPETEQSIHRLDFAYPRLRLAIEADSREFHSTEQQLIDDNARQNDLVRWGWSVLRFRTSQVRDRNYLVSTIRDAIRTREQKTLSLDHLPAEFTALPPGV